MEVTLVEQRANIKIAVFLGRKAMECHTELMEALGNNALPYRIVARWEPIPGRQFATREDIAIAVRQQATLFTNAANSEADGIQCLPHRWQRVVRVAGDRIEDL
ncbi:uncharacterized protein TNCV_2616501 [Trichonephila clavipes]|nr:uncharacterized protein TNCV_2616501 [Trichonephila clavipes]